MANVARCIFLLFLRNVIVLYLGCYDTVTKAHDANEADLGYYVYKSADDAELLRSRRQVSGNVSDINDTGLNKSTPLPQQSTVTPIVHTVNTDADVITASNTDAPKTTRKPLWNQGTTQHRFQGDIKEDYHKYYSSAIDTDPYHYRAMWKDLSGYGDAKRHDVLSRSYRVAATIKLEFPFRFYGNLLNNVTIATGGFLYMSPFLHRFLTATQYIAPLMANFDASYSEMSHIYYHQNKKSLRVQWTNLYLQDQSHLGKFTFQVILFSDNSISFVYNTLPTMLTKIKRARHPVKIGLSDAYYVNVDKTLRKLGNFRPTIFEYHNVKINKSQLAPGVIVRIRAHETCNLESTCSECMKSRANFDCRWCDDMQSCSDGFDWNRHRWLINRCHNTSNKKCPAEALTTQISTGTTERGIVVDHTRSKDRRHFHAQIVHQSNSSETKAIQPWVVGVIILVFLLVIIVAIGGWTYYAYTHPTSRSGLWLIQHRPSQMKQTLAKMKFWKRGSSGEERYGVESTA